MAQKRRTKKFYKLLHEIEYTIGSQCYNSNIQNYGPGGMLEGEGREFRYPIRYHNSDDLIKKYSSEFPTKFNKKYELLKFVLNKSELNSAHYAFGANQLYVFRGLVDVLEKLEDRFDLDFDELLKNELP